MVKGLKKWVRRLQKGDQSAFLPLYEKTSPGLMRFLLWKTRGNRPLSEDILQESFVRFLSSIDRLEAKDDLSLHSYMLRIVKNCLIDKAARTPQAKRPHVGLDLLPEIEDARTRLEQEAKVELRELAVALGDMNQRDSEILWLRDGLGFSHREVANEVGITEQASRQAYVRAKRTLIERFRDKFFPNSQPGEAYA